ncbi:MAG: hypothetical protein KAU14_04110, partial [Thermoplasmata archaeon]|nr:hypothetical protein [Thermoplasmata archaeon]
MTIQSLEEELEWDEMDTVPFEETEDGEYVKILGRINSTQDVVLERQKYENGATYWNVTDFNLTYQNHSIFVDMSDYDSIIWNNSFKRYRNGDLIYVVGTIYFEGENRGIHAETIVYDSEVYSDMFDSFYVAFMVIVAVFCVMLGVVLSMILPRLIFPKRRTNIDFPKSNVPDHSPPEYLSIPRSRIQIVMNTLTYLCWILFIASILAWIITLCALFNLIDFDVDLNSVFYLFIASLINSIILAFVLSSYPNFLESVLPARDG